jgi:hypothetical protein
MNHGYPPPRVMGGPQVGPTQRLNELLDNIRTEFETESQRSVDYEGQSECASISFGVNVTCWKILPSRRTCSGQGPEYCLFGLVKLIQEPVRSAAIQRRR